MHASGKWSSTTLSPPGVVHPEEIKNRLTPINLRSTCILCGGIYSFALTHTDFYSSHPLTGFGPIFQRVTALTGSWEEAIAEIDCKVDSELPHRLVPPPHDTVDQNLISSAVPTMSSIL